MSCCNNQKSGFEPGDNMFRTLNKVGPLIAEQVANKIKK